MKSLKIEGRSVVIRDAESAPINDIDTDMIFHNSHLHITKLEEMGKFAFGNLEGLKEYPNWAEKGDILLVGKNFGAGSSRQQAVDCFKSLGVSMIIGESFGAIYKRNAINSGLPVMAAEGIISQDSALSKSTNTDFNTGDSLIVDLGTGKIENKSKGFFFQGMPLFPIQLEIYKSGGLFAYSKKLVLG